MTNKELELRRKNELEQRSERTDTTKIFVPEVDIFETEDQLMIQANMPGVKKEDVEINIKDNMLSIQGKICKEEYEGLRPIYGEYNVGHYQRSFELGNIVEQEKIEAKMEDGILNLKLPKAAKAKPRQISIN